MGRKSKYDTDIKPYLQQIKEWKKNGATEQQIAKQLGVAMSTFCALKNKYPEFSEALRKSQTEFVADLKGELARLAFKHVLKTKKVYKKQENGVEVSYTEITEKDVDGSITAINLLLKNNDKEWADDPKNLELKRQELELKKMLAEANNFDMNFDEEGDK